MLRLTSLARRLASAKLANDKYPLQVLILLPQGYEPCAASDELRGVVLLCVVTAASVLINCANDKYREQVLIL